MKIGATDLHSTIQLSPYADTTVTVQNLPANLLSPASVTFNLVNQFGTGGLSNLTLSYQRRLLFSGADSIFLFELPASPDSMLLRFVRFNTSASPQVLTDLTNDISMAGFRTADTTLFAIPPSALPRKLLLYAALQSTNNRVIRNANNLEVINFVDPALEANRGDYLIVTHQSLRNLNGNDPVEQYAAMRESAAGNSYNAVIYDIEQLYHQFGQGVAFSPVGIRNFTRYAYDNFSTKPKFLFLIGSGLTYQQHSDTLPTYRLNLVPTWGTPASDNLLSAFGTNKEVPLIPTGRLNVTNALQVANYLQKINLFLEQQQPQNAIGWQKQITQLIGGNDAAIVPQLDFYMNGFANILSDTLIGANIKTFRRLNDPNTAKNNELIKENIKSGTGLINYFGHSSSSNFDFDLNNPELLEYTRGRYPIFIANGCNASEFFNYVPEKLNNLKLTLSERFVFQPEGGAVAFLSSSSFGVLQSLGDFTNAWFRNAARSKYGKEIGSIHSAAIQDIVAPIPPTSIGLFNEILRLTTHQFVLHGDPALVLNTVTVPDYYFDSSATFVSNANPGLLDDSLEINIKVLNGGILNSDDSITLLIKRKTPDGKINIIDSLPIKALGFDKSFRIKIPLKGNKEAGLNELILELDPNNEVVEMDETNNLMTLAFTLEAQSVSAGFPAEFSILNTWPTLFYGFSGQVITDSITYRFQLDTTTQFNSPLLQQVDKKQPGGTIVFNPTGMLLDSTVYYWRIAPLANGVPQKWSASSFTYLPETGSGFNQGHYFQFLSNSFDRLKIDALRTYQFDTTANNLYATQGILGQSAGFNDSEYSVTRNGLQDIYSACIGSAIMFNVFDSLNFMPWKNTPSPNGLFNSTTSFCNQGRAFNFEYSIKTAATRKHATDFLQNNVPNGNYVVVRFVMDPPYSDFDVKKWQADTAINGSGYSLYHALKNQGLKDIDLIRGESQLIFIFKKGDTVNFKPRYTISAGLTDRPVLSANLLMPDTSGAMQTPLIGPANNWQAIKWKYQANVNTTDSTKMEVYGVNPALQTRQWLFTMNSGFQDTTLQTNPAPDIDPVAYPYLQLNLLTKDTADAKPGAASQLQVLFDPYPEGAIVPNEYFEFNNKLGARLAEDTIVFGVAELGFGVGFRNISNTPFNDSIPFYWHIEDSSAAIIDSGTVLAKPLEAGGLINMRVLTPVNGLQGRYTLYMRFNANNQVKEQTLSNNFIYHSFIIDTNIVQLATNVRYFVGNGNWNADTNWLPQLVPQCGDSVIIIGQAVINDYAANAASVTINRLGSLTLNNSLTTLSVGCNADTAKSIVNVLGELVINDGLLQVRGGMMIANGSTFEQHGGEIKLNALGIDAEASLPLLADTTAAYGMHGILSIGGNDPTPGSVSVPFVEGAILLTGGKLILINPAAEELAGTISIYNAVPVTLGENHTIELGTAANKGSQVDGNGFVISLNQPEMGEAVTLGKLIHMGTVPSKALTIKGSNNAVLQLLKELLTESQATVIIGEGIKLNLLNQ